MDTRILYIAQIERRHRANSLISCAFNSDQEAIKYAKEGAANAKGPAYVYKVEYESDAIEEYRGGITVLDPEAYVEADLIWSTDPQAPYVADADYAFDPYYGPQVYTESLKENVSGEIIYSVNSDLDDEILYAEFKTKDTAIEYAKRNLDKLPFVDALKISRDANGEIDDVLEYKTIWDHTMVDTKTNSKNEDEYWDMLADVYKEEEKNKYDTGDTTWFESVDTDHLVETMEENEDMVECKECFELFPKTDCIKLDFGYICPTCADAGKLISVSDEDTFKVEFPEYEKFQDTTDIFSEEEPVSVEVPTEPLGEPDLTPEEAIPFLVEDEVEAVAGYEKAAEVVTDSNLENKEEILDTIDHIKEEEEEHIEELQDLMDNETTTVENDPISNEEEIETIEDPEVAALKENTTGETKYWMCFYDNLDVAVVEAANEDEAMDFFMNNYNDEFFFDSWDHDWDVEEISKEEYDEWEESYSVTIPIFKSKPSLTEGTSLKEHVNKECSPIESDQKLNGIDNAVVDCKVAKVIAHSEDEKPVDCKGEKKPLEKPLTEDFGIYFKTQAEWDEFKKLCDEIGIHTMGDVENFMRHENATPDNILDALREYRKELGDDFEIRESLYNFTKEEIAEYNMDENGVSLDSYDEYVRCSWCGEIFTKDSCVFEANLGWLCDRCYQAILSRGEKLTIIKNPSDEDIAKTLTEEVKMTAKELKDKFGTDDVELINAGREPEKRVKLEEAVEDEEDEIEVASDSAEKPSKNTKMANTSSINGMDFEEACKKYGINLEDSENSEEDEEDSENIKFRNKN